MLWTVDSGSPRVLSKVTLPKPGQGIMQEFREKVLPQAGKNTYCYFKQSLHNWETSGLFAQNFDNVYCRGL